jgi:hypothetical protein
VRKGYVGEAEIFAVYIPDMEKIYLIPVDMVSIGSKAMLRLKKTRNNQEKGIQWARDFELR